MSNPCASAAGGGYLALAVDGDKRNSILSELEAMSDASMKVLNSTNPHAQWIARGEAALAKAPQTGCPCISQPQKEPARRTEELDRICWQTLKNFVNAPSPDGAWEGSLEESRRMLATARTPVSRHDDAV